MGRRPSGADPRAPWRPKPASGASFSSSSSYFLARLFKCYCQQKKVCYSTVGQACLTTFVLKQHVKMEFGALAATLSAFGAISRHTTPYWKPSSFRDANEPSSRSFKRSPKQVTPFRLRARFTTDFNRTSCETCMTIFKTTIVTHMPNSWWQLSKIGLLRLITRIILQSVRSSRRHLNLLQ